MFDVYDRQSLKRHTVLITIYSEENITQLLGQQGGTEIPISWQICAEMLLHADVTRYFLA
jgi:hypothetical protein